MSIIVGCQLSLFGDTMLLHVRNADGGIDLLDAGETLARAAACHEFPLVTTPEHAALLEAECDQHHTQTSEAVLGLSESDGTSGAAACWCQESSGAATQRLGQAANK